MVTQPGMPVGPEAEEPPAQPDTSVGLDALLNGQPKPEPPPRLNGSRPLPPYPAPAPDDAEPRAWPAQDQGPAVAQQPGDPAHPGDPAQPGTDPQLIIQLPGPFAPQAEETLAAPQESDARPRVRLGLVILAALLGVAGLVASLAGVAVQVLPRRFSAAQQHEIMSWQVASRWRSWPAGRIFPASVAYQDPSSVFGGAESSLPLSARRLGIAPQSSCAAATDSALAQALDARGCAAVLRATYSDATDSFVLTVGVAIMRGNAPAASSLPSAGTVPAGLRPGVEAVAFPGTLASRFGNRQRQLANAFGYGPYLVLYTAGYTDGRRRDQVSANPYIDSEMTSMASGVASAVGAKLAALPPPPKCPGSPGC